MRFLTEDMDSFMKERETYEVKVNRLSHADAHNKAKQALKDMIFREYGAETKAIYSKYYGVKPDEAYQLAMSDCKIKIDNYFNHRPIKVANQSNKVGWTNAGISKGRPGGVLLEVSEQYIGYLQTLHLLNTEDLKFLFLMKDMAALASKLNNLQKCHKFPHSLGRKKINGKRLTVYDRAQVFDWIDSHKDIIKIRKVVNHTKE